MQADVAGLRKVLQQRGQRVDRPELLATAPEAGTNVVLITHTGTLLYSFGLETRPEGVAHVFRPGAANTSVYLGSLAPEDWVRFSGN